MPEQESSTPNIAEVAIPAQEATAPLETQETKKAADSGLSFGRRVAPTAPSSVPTAPRQTRNCLLVDDSRLIRRVARKIVESRGYVTAEAENGSEALEKCKIAMPDLIILDWDMPIMTGVEFLAELRALENSKQPKVVFCTTHSSVQDIHQAVNVGADEYVTKPFDDASLLAKLEIIGAG